MKGSGEGKAPLPPFAGERSEVAGEIAEDATTVGKSSSERLESWDAARRVTANPLNKMASDGNGIGLKNAAVRATPWMANPPRKRSVESRDARTEKGAALSVLFASFPRTDSARGQADRVTAILVSNLEF